MINISMYPKITARATQLAFDKLLFLPTIFPGRSRRLALAASACAIAAMRRILGDSNVEYTVHGATLQIPLSHALPRILLRHPNYSANIGRIAAAIKTKYPTTSMIDIGANVGDTIAMVRRYCTLPMLCIDGDPTFFKLLAKNAQQWSDIYLEYAFVGLESKTIAAELNSKDGTAYLSERKNSQKINVYRLSDILEQHALFSDSKLLKIDTDGYDTLIIKGSIDVLKKSHAVIYFEYDPSLFMQHDPNGYNVFSLLRSIGYTSALFFANTGELYANIDLSDDTQLRHTHEMLASTPHIAYFDICAFHISDLDICDKVHCAEIAMQKY